MKVKLKKGLLYGGVMYKAGEMVEFDASLGYSFTWLKNGGYIDHIEGDTPANEPDDGLVVTDGLPPLDEPKRRGKKNDNV